MGQFNNLGPRIVTAGGFQVRNGIRVFSGTGFPKSGSTIGTGTGLDRDGNGSPFGSLYVDESTGVVFVNEGSQTSPYWTPQNFQQRGLMGWNVDFRNGLGKADADTGATATLVESGIRVHGQGIAETDSGLTVTMDDQGAVGDAHTTDEDAHLIAISVGTGTTPLFQPDQNGTCVIDVNVAMKTALTTKAAFVGFCGSAADALDPIMTYSGTTISFAATIGDDVAGLAFSSELTAATTWMAPHDKGNANASIATTATGVNTGVTVATAGTYQRLRVECDADGAVRCFIAKALVATFAASTLDADEEIQPLFFVESSTTAVQAALIKRFSAWGKRA